MFWDLHIKVLKWPLGHHFTVLTHLTFCSNLTRSRIWAWSNTIPSFWNKTLASSSASLEKQDTRICNIQDEQRGSVQLLHSMVVPELLAFPQNHHWLPSLESLHHSKPLQLFLGHTSYLPQFTKDSHKWNAKMNFKYSWSLLRLGGSCRNRIVMNSVPSNFLRKKSFRRLSRRKAAWRSVKNIITFLGQS